MPTALLYFVLGMLATGVVVAPLLLKKRSGDAPPIKANSGGEGVEGQAKSGLLATLPSWAAPVGGGAVVLAVAAGLYFATSDKPADTGVEGVSPPMGAPGGTAAGAKLPDVDTMIGRLAKRLQDKPNDPEGWKMLGWSYAATHKYSEAVDAYQKAVALNPKDAELHAALGEARTRAAGYQITPEAEAEFKSALSLDSGNPRARLFLARKDALGGDAKGAIETMFTILKTVQPDSGPGTLAKELIRKTAGESGINVSSRLPPETATMGDAATAPMASAPAPPAQAASGDQQAMILGMVDRLDARLKAEPKNLDGWIMLVRSRKQLGQDARAKEDLRIGLAVFKDDSASRDKLSAAAKSFGVE